ncbi:hypothetical protein GCM10010123_20370 [Pilimelia anulata]|uniref:Mandelate racemase n=1 Tax=Pilimelia anulata TaxID=53371 RepID=A0A8J3F9Z8_9ACTN|nr:enolase C-terminal domain-like protein [Pilimelia anulata]GGJ90424.1 hypothetical protein GCM10010123_20370 [Pilimelia anulata]
MSAPVITDADVTERAALAGAGDDHHFVAVTAGEWRGWYGAVSRPVAVRAAKLASLLTGHSVDDHAGILAKLTPHAVDSVDSWAIGALDCAVWDLHAKHTNLPVAALLTGQAPAAVDLYASWLNLDLHRPYATRDMVELARQGWLFTKWALRRPFNRPDTAAQDLATAVTQVAAIVGQPAAFDALFTWNNDLLRRFRSWVDLAALRWLEDPLAATDATGYRTFTRRLPIAVGERLSLDMDPADVLGFGPAALTLDVVGCGGLTRAIGLAERAHRAGILTYPHGRSFVAGVHLAAAMPHAVRAVEYQLPWMPRRQRLLAHDWTPDSGRLPAPGEPGLGADPRSL